MSDLIKRLENQSLGVNLTLSDSRANGRDALTKIDELTAELREQKLKVIDVEHEKINLALDAAELQAKVESVRKSAARRVLLKENRIEELEARLRIVDCKHQWIAVCGKHQEAIQTCRKCGYQPSAALTGG